ncbi:MraY family glycosyltransferase [Paenibacillus alba]|uniref:UDP-N-acetylmuramyl pentapeptide phosphotransferase n=1 Tax=Paenibacillus alba TaxID=1197127 RepID=A0ABU6G9Y2_9BACL|nr:hypothetical protein [Paenibacillus alba]MEC0230951.1 hypothetical protein [Paenibacillus alba]
MGLIGSILDLIVLAAAGRWLLPHVQRFLTAHGQVELNYAGLMIPRGMGIVLWLLLWLQELMLQVAAWVLQRNEWMWSANLGNLGSQLQDWEAYNRTYTLAATIIFLLGWTDDVIGSKTVKGLRGHFQYWIESKIVSMGAVKAIGTLAVAIWLVISLRNGETPIWQMGVQLLLLVLMTNALNLMDVRPGRSLKVYVGIALFVVIVGLLGMTFPMIGLLPAMPVCIGVLLLYKSDIGGRGMLGDAGANLLGFTLGYGVILSFPWLAQCVMMIGLIFLHKLAEASSLTKLIERNRFLNWLDHLGRT